MGPEQFWLEERVTWLDLAGREITRLLKIVEGMMQIPS